MAQKLVKPENLHIKVVSNPSNDVKFDESQGLLTLNAAGSFLVTVKELTEHLQQVNAKNSERFTRDQELYNQRAKEGWSKEKLDQNLEYNKAERTKTHDASLEESGKLYSDVNWAWVIAPKEIVASDISHNKYFAKGIGKYNKKKDIIYSNQSINFPEFLEGGGMCYLEAFFPNKQVGRPPNGIYVNAIGTPSFIRTFWTDMAGNEISAETIVAFGSRVQLHIYTGGLYGQEIEIGLMDRDKTSFDDCLLYGGEKSFFREVNVHLLKGNEVGKSGVSGLLGPTNDNEKAKNYVQKSVVDVWVDFSWIQQGGENLEIYPLVKSKKTGKELKVQESVKLQVRFDDNATQFDFVQEYSNNPAMVDNIETDVASFLPCGYEAIYYQYGVNPEIEVFNENKPATISSGNFEGATISVVAPPKGSKNIKNLYIRLGKVNTNDCLLEDSNIGKSKKTVLTDTHKGHVIDISNLQNAGIESQIIAIDEQLKTRPTYNYKYDKSSAKEFLKNYFLVSSMLSNRDIIENQFKGILMDWEIQNKHLINFHKIGLKTCSHQKDLHLKIYPDVGWAFHAMFDDPFIPEYYNNNKTIKTVKGLDAELDALKNSPLLKMFTAPIIGGGLAGSNFIIDFVIDIIKDMAERYELGFTAYYDFDEDGQKNNMQIDYAEVYPTVFKVLIAGIVTIEILIDILLIILTEGAALANFISKAGKVAKVVNKGEKLISAGKKADDILTKYSKTFEYARYGKVAKSSIEFMKGSYFRGYRFVDDPDIGIQPLMEERVKISPLLHLAGISKKKKLGELLLDATPIGMMLNMADTATGFGLGISGMLLRKLESGKKAVSWYNAITYPLRIINKGIKLAYDLLAFATDEVLEEVFGAGGEYEKDITAHIDLDFWIKIQNADKKMDILALTRGSSVADKSSVSFAPSGAFTVRLKFSGKVSNKVVVKAMHILTWNNRQEELQEFNAEGSFELQGNAFLERRYHYKADHKPYYEDKIAFTGLMGEYEYIITASNRDKDKVAKTQIVKEQKPKQFMLMEPCQLVFNSSEMAKNPSDDK